MKLLTKNLQVKTLVITGLLAFSCTKIEKEEKIVEVEVEKQVVKEITPITFATLTASQVQESGNEMFTEADNEAVNGQVILYNDDLRAFRINEMLEVRALAGGTYRVRNFLPHTFTNVEIQMTIEGVNSPIKVAHFESFPPLYEYVGDLPFADGETFLQTIEGNKISVENIKNLPTSNFKFTLVSDDPMFAKLKTIKLNTFYCFRPYEKDNKWDKVTNVDARNYLPLALNLAYVFSSDEFENAVLNAPYDFQDNGRTLDKADIVRRFRNVPRQNLGIVVKYGILGLGGGDTFGIRREYLGNPNNNFYKQLEPLRAISSPLDTWVHEFSHVAGYGHNGNMTYYRPANLHGIVPLTMKIYQQMLKDKQLPFSEYPYTQK
ncbi:hypothetical protein [Capnocytophaga sp.]|uniref:hypothetical protein n=1 Tax=Capnocytophaga sp. TaxID=44737 RepID=UPI0026DCF998|nr:hypothetical protein [Capnocytophaga sp.]MDO5104538.1 hypothetical protein [Capnocytophaga sp.]